MRLSAWHDKEMRDPAYRAAAAAVKPSQDLADRLVAYRLRRKWTTMRMAFEMQMREATVWRLEEGNASRYAETKCKAYLARARTPRVGSGGGAAP